METKKTPEERISTVEANVDALRETLPTSQDVLRLAQIVAILIAIVTGVMGLAGLKTFGDLRAFAEEEVRKKIPAASEAKELFQQAEAAATEYRDLLEETRGLADDISAYKEILQERPNPQLLLSTASHAASDGDHSTAMEALRQLLGSEDADAATLQIAGNIAAQELGVRSMAIEFTRRAKDKVPTNPEYQADYLELLSEDPDLVGEAEAQFHELGRLNPRSDRLFRSLGNFYQGTKDFENLRAYADELVKLHESGSIEVSHVVYQLRARASAELYEPLQETERWWRDALRRSDGKDGNIVRQFGGFLAEAGECEKAEEVFSENIGLIGEGRAATYAAWAGARISCGTEAEGCAMADKVVGLYGGTHVGAVGQALLAICTEIQFFDVDSEFRTTEDLVDMTEFLRQLEQLQIGE